MSVRPPVFSRGRSIPNHTRARGDAGALEVMKGEEVAMKVKELMSTDVKSCREETDLATVVRMMWEGDCGIVPVVDDQLHVTGVITDRDICVAAGTRSLDPARIRVSEAMARNVATCLEDADARTALRALKEHR